MGRRFAVYLCVSLLFAFWPASLGAESMPRIAVLELRGALPRGQLAVMSDKVRAGVLQALQGKDFVVMSRENMAMLLRDMGLDCESAEGECEVETGRNIGAAYVVSGSVEDVGGGLWLCSIKVHDTETGALKSTGDVRGKQVIQLIDQLPSTVAQVMIQAFGGSLQGTVPVSQPVVQTGPTQAQFNLDFGGGAGGLGVQAKLKEQECERDAQQKGTRARAARMTDAVALAQSQASRAWTARKTELEMCTKLDRDQRSSCISAVEQWLGVARTMTVDLPAGVETVQTDCGSRQPAYSKESRTITGDDLPAAEALLVRLQEQDEVVLSGGDGDARVGSYPAIRGQKVYVTYSQAGEAKAMKVIALLKKHGANVLTTPNSTYFSWNHDLDYEIKDEELAQQVQALMRGTYTFNMVLADRRSIIDLRVTPEETEGMVSRGTRPGSYPAIRGRKVYVTYSRAGASKAQTVIALLKKHGAIVLTSPNSTYFSWNHDLDYEIKDKVLAQQVQALLRGTYTFNMVLADRRSIIDLRITPEY